MKKSALKKLRIFPLRKKIAMTRGKVKKITIRAARVISSCNCVVSLFANNFAIKGASTKLTIPSPKLIVSLNLKKIKKVTNTTNTQKKPKKKISTREFSI